MKLSKFANLVKNGGRCAVLHVAGSGIWLSTGTAIYRATELPDMEGSEQVRTVLDMTADAWKKVYLTEDWPESINNVLGLNLAPYHCNTNNYKSQSGVKPKANITRSTARTSIHNLGSNIWQSDIQMRMTIWMLYLVEFADWNSQKTIGKGCGNNSATENMGYTDSMPYHTGTTLASRDSYGLGTQYRYIEGLWDNVYDWGDGCYYNSNGLNIINTPSSFSDNSGGTAVGVPSSGWPSAFTVATVAGLEWVIYPTASGGSETTYSADYWSFGASSPCLFFGGYYSQGGDRGLFYVGYGSASYSGAYIGCRLQKLP